MPNTPNHNYEQPNKGTSDWNVPLNDNFGELDTDVEIRDTNANRTQYTAKPGAKFFATDTGDIYLGVGGNWNHIASSGQTPTFQDRAVSQLGAKATLSAGETVPNDTNAIVPYNDIVFDDRSEFDTSTHKFTATVDGRYHAIAQLNFNAPNPQEFMKCAINKNGGKVARTELADGAPSQFQRLQCQVHIELSSGDTVAVETRHKSGGGADLFPGASDTWFSILRLG